MQDADALRQQGNFVLNRDSYLWRRGLRFAMLGTEWGQNTAWDSGPLRARGVYSGNINYASWEYDRAIFRPRAFFTNSAAKIDWGIYPILGSGAFSVSAWVLPLSTGLWDGPICEWGDAGTAHDYFALNMDNTGYVHADQASSSNSATFVGALNTDDWNHILYIHRPDSPVNGDTLWVNGTEASGGGVGSTNLDIVTGDTMCVGESPQGSAFNIYGAIADLMIFDQQLGESDAQVLSYVRNNNPFGLIATGDGVNNVHDLEGVR